jgi:peptide-methionine (R)-S-oxide reductase
MEGLAMTKVQKSEAEWRALLSAEEYRVTREKGTERAFTGEYWNAWADGKYRCRCCGEILFEADTKFESGCGWPSFYQPADSQSIAEEVDTSHGMVRTEVTCSNCGAHLGHVFPDGPQPTGLRYCINSVSVKLDPEAS